MERTAALERARSLIKELELDGIFVTDRYNVRYLSGFTGSEAVLLLFPESQYLITDFRYQEQADRQCPGYEIRITGVESRMDWYNRLISENGRGRIGYEEGTMTVREFRRYQEEGGQEKFIPLADRLDLLRVRKEPWELERIAEAERIGDDAFSHILGFIQPGRTEIEVALELEFYMRSHGAERLSFDTIVASGVNSSMPHAEPGEKKLERGDLVTMDFGCVYQGYCSDMTRTVVIGRADDRQKEIYSLVLRAQEEVLRVIRAGQVGREVDRVARDVIAGAGYGECFGHGLGHSVGLFIHEEPRYSTGCSSVVPELAVMSVEPGIYLPGWGGVRIEDLVVVRNDGYENLTHSPKQLIEL